MEFCSLVSRNAVRTEWQKNPAELKFAPLRWLDIMLFCSEERLILNKQMIAIKNWLMSSFVFSSF